MKYLKTVLSNDAPNVRDALWLKPEEGGVALYVLEGGCWAPLKLVNDNATPTVSDDKVKTTPVVTNITALTTKQCNALNTGDQVIKKTGSQKHLYTVTYKEDKQGLCLTYMDAENVETVAYDWNGTSKTWEYNDTTITPLT